MKKVKINPEDIQTQIGDRWEWIYNTTQSAVLNKTLIEKAEKDSNDIYGKYMFFSDDRELLVMLGKRILFDNMLYKMKVSIETTIKSKDIGFNHVLCVYDYIPRHLYMMKQYEIPKVKYLRWKKEKETKKGMYSEQYAANQFAIKSEKRKTVWTKESFTSILATYLGGKRGQERAEEFYSILEKGVPDVKEKAKS
jgi:hypothetical protein